MRSKNYVRKAVPPQLSRHEQLLVDFLVGHGFHPTIIPPSPIPGVKTPDFLLNDLPWEAKTLFQNKRSTVEHAFHAAMRQAPNVIFDIRFTAGNDTVVQKRIIHEFQVNKNVKRLMIITKSGDIIQKNK